MRPVYCFALSAWMLLAVTSAHAVRAACDVPSAYSVLSSASTGSAFCSTLLYPSGASTVTTTVLETTTGTCKTVTTTETISTKTTITVTRTTVLPSVTYKSYSSTVLVPSGTHMSVDKRAAQAGSTSASLPTTASTTTTASATVLSADGNQQCSPTPKGLCNCPSPTISTACSSLIPSPTPVTSTSTDISTIKCPKTTTTLTTNIGHTATSIYTLTASPPPKIVSKSGVLTTTVPYACAQTPYLANGSLGVGNNIEFGEYPNFPQNKVDCCILCYDASQFPNCVASAFIEGSLSCELLVKVNATEGEATSKRCPLGIEDYPFGEPKKRGNVFPGPCGF